MSRLDQLGIQLAAETQAHFLFTRGECIALVEHRDGGYGSIGATGIMTEHGLAYLIWRDGQAFLKSKQAEVAADEAQIATIRCFSQDLESALR